MTNEPTFTLRTDTRFIELTFDCEQFGDIASYAAVHDYAVDAVGAAITALGGKAWVRDATSVAELEAAVRSAVRRLIGQGLLVRGPCGRWGLDLNRYPKLYVKFDLGDETEGA